MPGFRVFSGTDVPGDAALKRLRELLSLTPDQIAGAVQLAAQLPAGMVPAPRLASIAERLGVPPAKGMERINTVLMLAAFLERRGASNADMVHDFTLVGLNEEQARALPDALDLIRPSVAAIAQRHREAEATGEVLPTIVDFSAACDLRAIFSQRLGPEHILSVDPLGDSEDDEVVAWVPMAIVTLEIRDFAGHRAAATFQAPPRILRNLIASLTRVEARLQEAVQQSATTGSADESGRGG